VRGTPGVAGAAAAFIRLSESRRKVPEMAIRSPGFSPLRISTLSPDRQPVSTSRGSKIPSPYLLR
jgi:hypothetical protein